MNIFNIKREIICWNCKSLFLLNPEEIKGICPVCKKVNDIILNFDDLIQELKSFLVLMNCSECGHKLLFKKKSEFIICSNCKRTIVVDPFSCYEINEKIDLTPDELYSLIVDEKKINQKLFSDDLYEFIVKNYKRLFKEKKDYEMKNYPLAYKGDEHLYQFVKKNHLNITQKYFN